ncbi:MAG: hypothetical protein GTO45_31150 [Candidatus Aminicenantes bacterium]|nr:hypothetical protein [Candidatus Aminicenantes bacterium]NIM83256.1 hypothetical protein [Candidatus Aminicenantes bacterium]NIN22627.1 hypothetical protein [Candidatus Aminicenantes bacterium]NIN46386.1 hypothetical protein [Candidatus Aminicenantes bacterium]NIN89236.1 hypothetical protein [Candidatus Aminicenantes bacterium]
MKFIIPIIITIVAVVFMAAALHFSKYKKRKGSGCCSGGKALADYTGKTCEEDDSKMCIC